MKREKKARNINMYHHCTCLPLVTHCLSHSPLNFHLQAHSLGQIPPPPVLMSVQVGLTQCVDDTPFPWHFKKPLLVVKTGERTEGWPPYGS